MLTLKQNLLQKKKKVHVLTIKVCESVSQLGQKRFLKDLMRRVVKKNDQRVMSRDLKA